MSKDIEICLAKKTPKIPKLYKNQISRTVAFQTM